MTHCQQKQLFGQASADCFTHVFVTWPLAAGFVGQFNGRYKAGEGAGFIASVVMAVIVLAIYGQLRGASESP